MASSLQPSMTYRVSTTCARGDKEVTFRLDLAAFKRGGRGDNAVARVMSLDAEYAERTVSFDVDLALTVAEGKDTYSSYMVAPFAPDSNPRTVAEKLASFASKTVAHFPFLAEVPMVALVGTDQLPEDLRLSPDGGAVEYRYVVTLPPFTALYTGNAHALTVLGFEASEITAFSAAGKKKGKKASATEPKYGFVNSSPAREVTYSSPVAHAEDYSVTYQALLTASGEPTPSTAPNVTLEVTTLTDWMPLSYGAERRSPRTRLDVVAGLRAVLSDGLAAANIRGPVQVTATGDSQIRLSTSRTEAGGAEVAESAAKLEVRFNGELAQYLKLSDPTIQLDLLKPAAVTLGVEDAEDDGDDDDSAGPLASHLPISLVPLGHTGGTHYIEGLGVVSLLAFMKDKDSFWGPGLSIKSYDDLLRLCLVTKSLDVYECPERMKFTLTLEIRFL